MNEPTPFGRYVITDATEQQRWIALDEWYDPDAEPVVSVDGEPYASWSDQVRDYLTTHPEAEVAVVFTDWGGAIGWRLHVGPHFSVDFGYPLVRPVRDAR